MIPQTFPPFVVLHCFIVGLVGMNVHV